MILSVTRERTDVIEIGRKSLNWAGLAVFGTGQILACFHWTGTVDVSNERLMRLANGLAKNGAPSLKKHADRWSNPVDVHLKSLPRTPLQNVINPSSCRFSRTTLTVNHSKQ